MSINLLDIVCSAPGIVLSIGEPVTVDGLQGRGIIVAKKGNRVTVKYRNNLTISRDVAFVHKIDDRMNAFAGMPSLGSRMSMPKMHMPKFGGHGLGMHKGSFKPTPSMHKGSKGMRAAEQPKCPHCGFGKYTLMPTDFETAKCSKCGKEWDHGIIKGINDPGMKAYEDDGGIYNRARAHDKDHFFKPEASTKGGIEKKLQALGDASAMINLALDPIPTFRPPSAKNSKRKPTDDVREDDDQYLDVTKRNASDTQKQRMDILKRGIPGGNPPLIPAVTTLVQHNTQNAHGMWASGKKRLIQRPARPMKAVVSSHSRNIKASQFAEGALQGGMPHLSLFRGLKLTGFTIGQAEEMRAMLSRIPYQLLRWVTEIKCNYMMGAVHGQYMSDHTIQVNPHTFELRTRFGEGPGWISHAELMVIHEIGHSAYEAQSDDFHAAWQNLVQWKHKGEDVGHTTPYIEKRPGWEPYVSNWYRRKYTNRLPRGYSEKNPSESFADCFAFYILGKPAQMSPRIRQFIKDFIARQVTVYPKTSIEGPVKP